MELSTLLLVFLCTLVAVQCSTPVTKSSTTPGSSPNQYDHLPQSCAESPNRASGIQRILPQPGFGEPFEVYCDQRFKGGGWTVIQNRFAGSSVYFHRSWNDYEHGFGNMNGEFWLGLRRIHELTNSQPYELRIILEDRNGTKAFASYSHFLVAGPETKYRLERLGSYRGTAGDSLNFHLNSQFSTFNSDNDSYRRGCAARYRSGWWFKNCFFSDLNGLKWETDTGRGMNWYHFRRFDILQRSRMMIRVRNH